MSNDNFKKFKKFHKENPQVYKMVIDVAKHLKDEKYNEFGTLLLFEIVRYSPTFKKARGDDYKLNNNHKAFYSRLFLYEYPEFKSVLKIRRSSADHINWDNFNSNKL